MIKKDTILAKLLSMNEVYGESRTTLDSLIEALKQDIRDENNKASGRGNMAKLANAILKNAKKRVKYIDSPMHYAKTINGFQYVLDGHRLARFYNHIDLPEIDEEKTGKFYDVKRMIQQDAYDFSPKAEMKLPNIADLKAEIKILKAEKYKVIGYLFDNGVFVDAEYLLDFMTGFADMKIFPAKSDIKRNPLYIDSKEGDGILMPINQKTDTLKPNRCYGVMK